MDLFFDAVPIEAKRRVHFNQFMLDVHARLHRLRGSREDGVEPIIVVVRELMEEGWLLCFDEFQVTDVVSIANIAVICRTGLCFIWWMLPCTKERENVSRFTD